MNMHDNKGGRGFTLIEMMAVIVVMGVLAMAAIPNIQQNIIRKQVDTVVSFAAIAQKPVEGSWGLLQKLPADNAAVGLPAADKIVSSLVSSVSIENGVVSVTFGNSAYHLLKGKVLSLRPAIVTDAKIVPISWVCGYAKAPDKMTVQGSNRTNIDSNYLPSNCAKPAG